MKIDQNKTQKKDLTTNKFYKKVYVKYGGCTYVVYTHCCCTLSLLSSNSYMDRLVPSAGTADEGLMKDGLKE